MDELIGEEGWLIPAAGPPWLRWGFGTRDAVLRNELAQVKQVHGAHVLEVSRAGLAGEADALVTREPGLFLGIQTADCLPILMVDLHQRAVAAVHAGWRGTAQGIVGAAVHALEQMYGTKPNDLLVAMGPAIGPCCFEVGAEVAQAFAEYDPELSKVTGRYYLDLQAINRWQLGNLGVSSEQILGNEFCTMCGGKRFWSYRKDGAGAGRLWSVVGII